MRNLYLKLFAGIFAVALFSGCNNAWKNFEGPDLHSGGCKSCGGSVVLDPLQFNPNKDTIDFTVTPAGFFTATFSQSLAWKMTITGRTSKAVRTILHVDPVTELNADNATWKGELDDLPFMIAGETVDVVLIIDKIAEPQRTSFVIRKPAPLKYDPVNSWLLTDFEFGNTIRWNNMQDATNGAAPLVATRSAYFPPALQGTSYLSLTSSRSQVSDGYCGELIIITNTKSDNFINFPNGNPLTYKAAPTTYFPINPTSTDDQQYFNVMLYGNGTPTTIGFGFHEDDDGDGVHEVQEDEWSYSFTVNYTGWRLVNVPYINTAYSQYNNRLNGNKVHEISKITEMSISVLGAGKSSPAYALLDYPIFTYNGPLVP